MDKILAFVPTRNRYFTTLPHTLMAIAMQSCKPSKLIIYDDGTQLDLRLIPTYQYILKLLSDMGIEWLILFGEHRGQHHGHQLSQHIAMAESFDLVWRVDDDEIPAPDCLAELKDAFRHDTMAVGGLVLDPLKPTEPVDGLTNKIDDINNKPNVQWFKPINNNIVEVDHLYSTFLYKPGKAAYNLGLSPVAHREETLFTMDLSKEGKLLFAPNAVTYHFRNPEGGIRQHDQSMWSFDEQIFKKIVADRHRKIVVLNNGLGDHIMFKKVMDEVGADVICCCYLEVFDGFKGELISIKEGVSRWGDLSKYSIYGWCQRNNYNDSFYKAYKLMYGTDTTGNK